MMATRQALDQLLKKHMKPPPRQVNKGILRIIDEKSEETDSVLGMDSIAEQIRMLRLQSDSMRSLNLESGTNQSVDLFGEVIDKDIDASNREYIDSQESSYP